MLHVIFDKNFTENSYRDTIIWLEVIVFFISLIYLITKYKPFSV